MLRQVRSQSTLSKIKNYITPTSSLFQTQQSPNRVEKWSPSQNSKTEILKHPRFVQKDLSKQPQPYAAIELIAAEPIKFVNDRIAVCQGNKQGNQGHPRVFINLDSEVNKIGTCGYCGLRFAQEKFQTELA